MTKQDMLQARADLIQNQRALLDKVKAEKRNHLTAEEEKQFDEYEKQIMELDNYLDREEQVTARETALNEPLEKPYRPGMYSSSNDRGSGGYEMRSGIKILAQNQKITDMKKGYYSREEEQLNLGKYLKGLVTGDWVGAENERKFLNQAATGQYLIPTKLSDTIIDLARNKSRVIEAGARTFEMTERKVTTVRQLDDPTLYWKKENDTITESDGVFDTVTHEAKTLVGMVRLSLEMFQDAHDIENILVNALTAGVALELDRVALLGTGVGEEPTGLYNTAGVPKLSLGDNGAALTNYVPFSKAAQMIQEQNGEANAVIYAPRTAGDIDRLVDSTGQPLTPPASFQKLSKFVTNQVPVDLVKGTATNASAAFVGDFSNVLYGIRTGVTIDVGGTMGSAFQNMQVLLRVYLRGDVQFTRPKHFTIIDGILPQA